MRWLLLLLLPTTAWAGKVDKRLAEATEVIADIGDRVPAEIRRDARCATVLIVGKGGFIVGATAGVGLLSCREPGGAWSAPVVLDVGGPSAGAQIGGSRSTVVMAFVNVDDIDAVARTSPVFQTQAAATAGKESAGIAYGGNPELRGGAWSVARSEGLYAGAVWESLIIKPDADATQALVGSDDLRAVLVQRTVAVPQAAQAFVAALTAWGK